MATELAYVLINPYTIAKSRTGGVIARFISRTSLDLVGMRMFGPSQELVDAYAAAIRGNKDLNEQERNIIADYVLKEYAPNPGSGKRRRVMMLLFEGEDAVAKVANAAGHFHKQEGSALTVRDTYGDFILNDDGSVKFVEPAVLIGTSKEATATELKLWADHSEQDGGIIDDADDVPTGAGIQKTLILIKPDNFRFPSARPGNIIDIFSASGLRIIAVKLQRMSVAEAEEFYGPVKDILRAKLKEPAAERAAKALKAEFGFEMPDDIKDLLRENVGPVFGEEQFNDIVKFMTGRSPAECNGNKADPGTERCIALIYAGENAVDRIREILGPTDPSKAQPGSVRREYGTDIMVNAAHASDSTESFERENGIVKVEKDMIKEVVNGHKN